MKRFALILSMAATMLAGCSKNTDIDRIDLDGTWYLSFADESREMDGALSYTFLEDGTCLVESYSALNPDPDFATHYSIRPWKAQGNMIIISYEKGDWTFEISKRKGGKLWSSDGEILTRMNGVQYKDIKHIYTGSKEVKMVTSDGVESTHTGVWTLYFEAGQKCILEQGIQGMFGTSRTRYICYLSPESGWFNLVSPDTMKRVYRGNVGKTVTLQLQDGSEIQLN